MAVSSRDHRQMRRRKTAAPLKVVNLRAKESEIEAWKAQASLEGLTLSGWLRRVAGEGLGRERPVEPGVSESVTAGGLEVAREFAERVVAAVGVCERRVPKGSFCKRCGRIHG